MSSTDKELEEQLMEAGNRLLQPPASVDELLPLLDVSCNLLDFDPLGSSLHIIVIYRVLADY